MLKIDSSLIDIGYMDSLARQQTAVHGLDPRFKVLTTLVYIVAVLSFDKHALSAMVPFLLYPLFLCSAGNIPLWYIVKKIIIVSPFAIFIGIFNPLLDSQALFTIAGVPVSGGWVSFFSILFRFVLTVGAALSLIAVSGFHAICMALERLGLPRLFTLQLLFLYRYLFVLTGEAGRMLRASALRRPDGNGLGLKIFGSLLGHLLLRTLDRAQRIHLAMQCRGFDGHIRTLTPFRIGAGDVAFFAVWSTLFFLMRYINIPQFIGTLFTELWL